MNCTKLQFGAARVVVIRRAASPGFKVPKAFHGIDAMPTGPSGKLFRRALPLEDPVG